MIIFHFVFFLPLTSFYIAYLTKMLILKRRGVQGNILGKGIKPKNVKVVERMIQIITYTGVIVQYASLVFPGFAVANSIPLWITGFALAWAGVALFIAAVVTMKNNWRAGYTQDQNTALVTNGIYRYSRNPAFAGFDLIYIGCAVAYPNMLTILWGIAAACVFHFQILSEEQYLFSFFGTEYTQYTNRVRRYFGKKNSFAG